MESIFKKAIRLVSVLSRFVCFLGYHLNLFFAVAMFFVLTTPSLPLFAGTTIVNQISGFQSPTRIAFTSSGNVYVSDYRQGVVVILDSTGNRVGTLKGLIAPLGVAVFEGPSANEQTVYVGDDGDGSVRIFVGGVAVDVLGAGRGEFQKPNGIAVTKDRAVYVVDSKSNEVKVYNSSGDLQFAFGTLYLSFPTDIVVNEAVGEVYITDFHNQRIVVFDRMGNLLRDITPPTNDMGDPVFFRPAGLGTDPAGNLYVVDNALSSVAIIDRFGGLLEIIGYQNGKYWTGDLSVPVDAVSDGQRIYVTSNQQRLLKVFEVVP